MKLTTSEISFHISNIGFVILSLAFMVLGIDVIQAVALAGLLSLVNYIFFYYYFFDEDVE